MTGSYHIINGGDATKPKLLRPTSQIAVTPHIVNDIGAWGSGFVIAIDKAFGTLSANCYRSWYRGQDWEITRPEATVLGLDKKFALGKTLFVTLDVENPKVVIANMVAQHGIGMGEDGVPPIRYEALEACMKSVATIVGVAPQLTEIHAPKFGSLRAGGDWVRIEQMIQSLWVDQGFIVVVYDFDEKAKP